MCGAGGEAVHLGGNGARAGPYPDQGLRTWCAASYEANQQSVETTHRASNSPITMRG